MQKNVIPLVTFKATLDKGLGTKSSGTNFNQIEPWIGPLCTLKKTFFSYGTMSVSKSLGSNLKVQYQNVWLTCQRIMLTFGIYLFFLRFFHGFFIFLIFWCIILLHTMELLSNFFIFHHNWFFPWCSLVWNGNQFKDPL